MSIFDAADDRHAALMTDLYQLTMAAAAFQTKFDHHATFELFTRKLQGNRGFLLAAGLEQALDYLTGLHFTGKQIDFLRAQHCFAHVSPEFFARLRDFSFTGDVWALPEGTPFFPDEPVLRVSGPAAEAQLVETYLLSIINFETLIATKAARVCHAANGKHVSDFGTRRAHGPEAGQLVARAAYIGGCGSTSNVEAGFRLGIPIKGTFAHSWVMSFDDEAEAFAAYHAAFPEDTTILLDTYDPIEATNKIVRMGLPVKAVRLDSGDLATLAYEVRKILDANGLQGTKIVASNDLNEEKIDSLERQRAPIDIYGVGTELAVSKDVPALGGVYKLVERTTKGGATIPCMKLAEGKRTWPGAKQVYRRIEDGRCVSDTLALANETPHPGWGNPLLKRVLKNGNRTEPSPPLHSIRQFALANVAALPRDLRDLYPSQTYPVVVSPRLADLAGNLERQLRR